MDFSKNLKNYLEISLILDWQALAFLIYLLFFSLELFLSYQLIFQTYYQPFNLWISLILHLQEAFPSHLYPLTWTYFFISFRSFKNINQAQLNNYINKKRMNILDQQQLKEHSFEDEQSQHFSIQQQTEQLINQVFNQKFEPVYNPNSSKLKEFQYKKQKKQANQLFKPKQPHKKGNNNKIYQNVEDQDVSPSFKQFLARAQERIEKRDHWLVKQREKKEEKIVKTLKDIPDILRGSREKIIPIYQRCIELQKSKQKDLEIKRIEKYRKEVEKAQSFTYHPRINESRHKKRTFQEYLTQKQIWQQEKKHQLQKKRVANQVKKLSQCTFTPMLVAKYNKPNPRIKPGEKVEQRLLRSLQKSIEKENIEFSQIKCRYEY